MPNIMLAPLDFTALSTAPVEESVWPKSPATPKEKVGVAATAVGVPHRPGASAASPTSSQREDDHDRPPDPQADQAGPWSARPALTVRTSRSSACGRPSRSELNPTATPVLSAAAVTPAPGSPDSGGRVLAFASASKSTACGRSTPSASPHLRGPDRAPVHQPGALGTTPFRLAVALRVAADVPRDRLRDRPLAATALPTAIPVSSIARAMPHAPPSPGSSVTLPPLSHDDGGEVVARLGAAHGDALAVDAVGVRPDVTRQGGQDAWRGARSRRPAGRLLRRLTGRRVGRAVVVGGQGADDPAGVADRGGQRDRPCQRPQPGQLPGPPLPADLVQARGVDTRCPRPRPWRSPRSGSRWSAPWRSSAPHRRSTAPAAVCRSRRRRNRSPARWS